MRIIYIFFSSPYLTCMNNILIYVLLILFAFALIVFIVWQNRKDREAFEEQEKQDYPRRKHEDNDIPVDMDRNDKI